MADTFTPLFDEITQRYGIVTSAVYGYIWRKCQLLDGYCNASFQTMADDLNISRRTIITHVKLLIDDKIIDDLTPDADRKPHKYMVKNAPQARETDAPTREINALAREIDSLALGQEIHQTREIDSKTREIDSPKDTNTNTTTTAHARLCKKFLMLTGIDQPHETTDDYTDKWQRPFEIWLARFGSVEAVEEKMGSAVSLMISKGLRFTSPKSLVKTIANEHSGANGQNNTNGHRANGSAPDKNQALENIRSAVTTYGAKKYKQAMETLGEPERVIVKNMASSWRDVCMMDKQTFQIRYYQAIKGA